MIKTKPANFLVTGQHRNHYWLEVIEGDDSGICVSVPCRSSEYSDELQQKVNSLTKGDIYKFVLFSREKQSPNWKISKIEPGP